MREQTTQGFVHGVQNKAPLEIVHAAAAIDALNWVGADGSLELIRGRKLIGADGPVGGIFGEFFAPKKDGTKVHYRKTDEAIQYFDGTDWQDVITGLTPGSRYTFSSYISLAGAFVYATGVDGLFKINTAHPGSYKDMYDAAKNHKGYTIISNSRMFLWNRSDGTPDKTALYLSKIDPQGSQYGTISNESIGTGDGIQTTFSGTLAEATGKRFVFGLSVSTDPASVTGQDDFLGTISGTGISGTINYATGAYSITFDVAPAVAADIRVSYQHEDSNSGGITDFTFSSTRVAGEGDIIPQEYLGEPIQNVIPFEGSYYSLKKTSVYQLTLSADDATATNDVYRSDIGIPSLGAATATGKGIVYMDTSNKPVLSILQRNPVGGNLEPVNLTPLFKWEEYVFDQCQLDTWDEFIIVSARTPDSGVNNRTFLVNVNQRYSVDITYYGANCFAKDGTGDLYCGDAFADTVYQIFSEFDDLGDTIENHWTGKPKRFVEGSHLQRVRYLRFKGLIEPAQSYEIYLSYDDAAFQLVGTIRGDQPYVDYSKPFAIGVSGIGQKVLGAGSVSLAFPYETEIPLRGPKFRVRMMKIVAKGIGYVSVEWQSDVDILVYEQRMPSRFRQKAWPNAAGTSFDNPHFGS